MKVTVFDIEADSLNATKIHCMAMNKNDEVVGTTSLKAMKKVLSDENQILVGHNIVCYDIPTLERLLDIEIKCKLIDTLPLSWYLYPNRVQHGLEAWGEDMGVPKPKIDDWENLSPEEYLHRCKEDVKINTKIWNKFWKYLLDLYESEDEALRLCEYLTWKMDCVREQERSGWALDVDYCEESLNKVEALLETAKQGLESAMPEVAKYKTVKKPKNCYKRDGSLSAHGVKWFDRLKEHGLPEDHEEPFKVVDKYVPPNADSHVQVKEWLFSLGWKPQTFKFVKDDDEPSGMRKIPQIKKDDDICPSVHRLAEQVPEVEHLVGYGMLNHRKGLLKGFLTMGESGWVVAGVKGLTNTLRFKHRDVVNLPGVDKPWGAEIRGCLIAPDGYTLCGSDMAALEDRTKQHYMWPYDPEYVKIMMQDGYCPHIDIAILAGYLSEDDRIKYATGEFDGDKDKKRIVAGRKAAKPVNYGGVYGIGPEGLARNTSMPLKQAKKLHKIYWERNWSVKKIAEACTVKICKGQKWLFNPVSKLWYSLRAEKDRFSTLNQGTGVWCFDTWVKHIRSKRPQMTGQFHDEVILCHKDTPEMKIKIEKLLRWAIEETNKELGLNRDLDIDVQFGENYAKIH